jgi:cell division transport system permease protein
MSLTVAGWWHSQALIGSLARLTRTPLATGLTLLVIAVALALPAGLELLVSNVRAGTEGFATALELSVYLKTGVSLERAHQLAQVALDRADVAEVSVTPADQALEEFRKYSGFGAALAVLKDNPLPHVLHIRPRPEAASSRRLEVLRKSLAAWPETDIVQLDSEWVQRFNAILRVMRRLLLMVAALLATGVLAIIGNTIRLEIQHRQGEIEVIKLVGATNAFVRRPFLYTGMLYGLGGALLAWGIVNGAVALLSEPVSRLAQLYGSHYALHGLPREHLVVLLTGGTVLGWLGAYTSATRHLRRLDP